MNTIKRILTLSAVLLLGTAAQAASVCSYGDEITLFTSPADWAYTLVDTEFAVPASYEPDDLVPLTRAGFNDERLAREILMADLAEMRQAAADLGHPIEIQSAYRSYAYQESTFAYWVGLEGREAALQSSARPGHSEHQLGTALDFRSQGGAAPWDLADWADTEAGAWMVENSWQYGFVLSYPRDSQAVTCYVYEPWHYRYLGRERAAAVHESGLTLREFLFAEQYGD